MKTTPDGLPEGMEIVHFIIHRKFYWATYRGLPYDSMVSAGWEGLCKAHEKYDPTLGYSFVTAAYPYIRGAIMSHIRRMLGWRSQVYSGVVPLEAAAGLSVEPSVELDVIDAERLLALLTPQERNIVVRHTVLDERHADIAAALHHPASSVRSTYSRAINKMRNRCEVA